MITNQMIEASNKMKAGVDDIMPIESINLYSPIGHTGYGITSSNIAIALHKMGIPISLFPIGNPTGNSEEDKRLFTTLLNNSKKFNYNAPCLKIWHQFELAQKIGNGKYYTYPFFELDRFAPNELHHLNFSDVIFASSQWAKDVLLNNNVKKPVYVAPLAVDTNIFRCPPKIKLEAKPYTFFNIGKWEKRKAQEFIISAFSAAFSPSDNVELRLIPQLELFNDETKQKIFAFIDSSPVKNKIKLYNRLATQYDLANFIWDGDCGLFVSRAEGWNNSILETMAINRPVIVTNYSAHTEYCDKNNSLLVDIDEVEVANDGIWFHGQGNWAKLGQKQFDQTVEYMRYVYHNNIRANPGGLETVKKYTWAKTAKTIFDTMTITGSFYANTTKKRKRR